jgi:hypothetical protein
MTAKAWAVQDTVERPVVRQCENEVCRGGVYIIEGVSILILGYIKIATPSRLPCTPTGVKVAEILASLRHVFSDS